MKWMLNVCVAASLLGTACGGTSTGAEDASEAGSRPTVGQPAPELSAVAVMGEGPKTLADGRGQVVIVDFWATYCDPCRKSFPQYQALVDKYGGDLAVIAVSLDEPDAVNPKDVKKFAQSLGVTFGVVWDKEGVTAKRYRPRSMPTSYVLDREGVLRFVHEGFTGGEANEIDKEVAGLLQ